MSGADVPREVRVLIGTPCFAQVSEIAIETGAIRFFSGAVQDATPQYWASDPAEIMAPPAMLSAWNRPPVWSQVASENAPGLALHFHLKQLLGLPLAVVKDAETELGEPMRLGSRVRCEQLLLSVSDLKQTRLGKGRFWVIRVDYCCAETGIQFGSESLTFFGYARGEDPQ